ncbi:snRNA-activating protein complex subunit 2 [Xenopus tropicalis]|uniref:Novel protein similar to SNAPC2 (Small nuclear RNA activating complex, polypeptide 2, 45kDa (Human)) n=1 Tax=Xenopus tropicalis TaxID=8364 RepID=Q28HR8_XENTR|nr:snRNA-activating protein complex subunit 2 [Xenopus tropicalis]CAJ82919.1 Novel protein similar to SNAPC2 (small nuclear RNA activating complex, polypeptide 2, 45kDa (Human)) [Xenopus tropicalis]
MKPPSRQRSAPVRYEIQGIHLRRTGPYRLAWTFKEKHELLKGLKAQKDKKEAEIPVQGRSQTEVASYISWLRGRAAREAIQTEYERWVHKRRSTCNQSPAPIDLWTDMARTVSEPAEEALTAAFSQMLTIAATEPISLKHSIPSRFPDGKTQSASHNDPQKSHGSVENSQRKEPLAEAPGLSASQPSPPLDDAEDQWTGLDYEKIYKYLSKAAKGEELPKLSKVESAVLLCLLHALPDQVQMLDWQPLVSFLRQAYSSLNSMAQSSDSVTQENTGDGHASPEDSVDDQLCSVGNQSNQTAPPSAKDNSVCDHSTQNAAGDKDNLSCDPPTQKAALGDQHAPENPLRPTQENPLGEKSTGRDLSASNNTVTNPPNQNTAEDQPGPNWKELKFCPLNPFMIPLNLLKQKETEC